ncbi:uncharacterized protein LOC108911215 [Anoplophora glabripennis]|uniref:uncharacterized protein LOC108911215 n=1 Tax=Anoplophora glabripennis TaxID=217634 RepID=UPI0008742BBC|nr:uncharacterized protein LOC108911215 [Anoplophora glabripennis]
MVLLISCTKSVENENFSVLDKLKSGLQLAGKFLNSDHAKGVANLVSEAFEKTHNKNNNDDKQSNIFSGFLRVLGFDTKKIGAITVNAIIFVAQLISSAIQLKQPSQLIHERKVDTGSLFDWVISDTDIADLLDNAKDEKLSQNIIEYVKERSLDEDTGCIQLLICKSSPFILQMQKSIKERSSNSSLGYGALYKYLPALEEVSDNGDACEKSYHYCTIPL